MGSGRSIARLGITVAVAVAISACAQGPAVPSHDSAAALPAPVGAEEQPRVPDEYLVTLAPDADVQVISEFYGRFGIKELDALGGETYLLVLMNDPGPREMEALTGDDSRFRAVQPNLIHWDYR